MHPNRRSSSRAPSSLSPPAYDANPWSYDAASAPPGANAHQYTLPANDRTPLLPQSPSPSRLKEKLKTWTPFSVLITFMLFILGLCVAWEWMQPSPEAALDPATRARMRREWDKEIKGHETARAEWEAEHQAIRRAWVAEVAAHETVRAEWKAEHAALVTMRERLVHDKEAWEAEKRADEQRKEKEQERLRASFYWEDLRAEQRCLRYGARRYSARVANVPREYDPVQACKETAVEIHGVEILSPTQCEDKGCGGVFGHWTVDYLEPTCKPHFDDFNDKGCTSPGSGRRHIESRLWNLQSGDDWSDMCSTTPATFRGLHFDSPEICENWGIRGVWGYWNIEDPACL
ncbi:hypothetical protein C8J57DRAFT_1319649 [Mycena rebaudengoi]|nr:hypothetical protein C8J57DRAFT_1403147 [Mycena rebaudengoi]KAJ7271784.1 hypothetical protein C8J57DRAFT_1319649 [Mycena rebaudengoi]